MNIRKIKNFIVSKNLCTLNEVVAEHSRSIKMSVFQCNSVIIKVIEHSRNADIISKNLFFYLLIALFPLLISGCDTAYNSLSNKNVSSIYNPSGKKITPEVLTYNISDTVTKVFVKLNPSEVFGEKNDSGNVIDAHLFIHYTLLNSYNEVEIVDSATIALNIDNSVKEPFVTTFLMKTPELKEYVLEVDILNQLKVVKSITFKEIDKSKVGVEQDYLISYTKLKTPIFFNWINKDITVSIGTERARNTKLFVRYYKNINRMPSPPFSLSNNKAVSLKPDSSWKISLLDSCSLKISKIGFYKISADSSGNLGFTIFCFNDSYPLVETPEKLLRPLRYLTSAKEFNELDIFADKKNGVDNFWLKSAGNSSRAKELIRVFYSRVIFTNVYFLSFKEGWMTDRGMMYIILGPPSIVYKTKNGEKWIYTESPVGNLTFIFQKVENKFTGNDYEMVRSDVYRSVWYQAVETWRNGRVFSITL